MTDIVLDRNGGRKRLSVSTARPQARREFTASELDLLREVASVLMPGIASMPAGGSTRDFDKLSAQAAAILDKSFPAIERGLGGVAGTEVTLSSLRSMNERDPEAFYWLSLLLVGTYIYSPEFAEITGYPTPRRNPPNPVKAADELDTGILDAVIERGQRYVDPEALNTDKDS